MCTHQCIQQQQTNIFTSFWPVCKRLFIRWTTTTSTTIIECGAYITISISCCYTWSSFTTPSRWWYWSWSFHATIAASIQANAIFITTNNNIHRWSSSRYLTITTTSLPAVIHSTCTHTHTQQSTYISPFIHHTRKFGLHTAQQVLCMYHTYTIFPSP